MLFGGPGLLVSLPARELSLFTPSGSLFTGAELRDVPLSHELRAALKLVVQTCAAKKLRILMVARPEMFTHGMSLDWLRSRLGGIEDHLCISDGTAVRPIPQMRNHLFLYRLGNLHNAAAFQRLSRCAPELLASMHSQVNTCIGFRVGKQVVFPPTVLLQASRTIAKPPAPKYYHYVPHASLETSVARILRTDALIKIKTRGYEQVTYVPMTEAASHDRIFANKVHTAIGRSYSQPSLAVVLRIPRLHATARAEERLAAALHLVRRVELKSARVAPLIFTTEDLTSDALHAFGSAVDFWMHSSFEFWSHPVEYYEKFRQVRVLGAHAPCSDRVGLKRLWISALGCEADGSKPSGAGRLS